MRSRNRSEPLDLERDLPTTAEDTEALRRARMARSLDLEDYLRFLEQLPAPTTREQRAKPGPRADQPFAIHWTRHRFPPRRESEPMYRLGRGRKFRVELRDTQLAYSMNAVDWIALRSERELPVT